MNIREVLQNNLDLGLINKYYFKQSLTKSYYLVTFNDGTKIEFTPEVGNNQNMIKAKGQTKQLTKVDYIFTLNKAPLQV